MSKVKEMDERTVHILGAEWKIKFQSEAYDELLTDIDGYCDWTVREIVIESEMNGTLANMEKYINKVIRHEIVHAFLLESGLAECSSEAVSWAQNEEMVDWFARMGPDIYAVWSEAGALDYLKGGKLNA